MPKQILAEKIVGIRIWNDDASDFKQLYHVGPFDSTRDKKIIEFKNEKEFNDFIKDLKDIKKKMYLSPSEW